MARLDIELACQLRHFNLALSLGVDQEVVALVGPSGAGKTTVLRMVAGLQRPEQGRIICDDEAWLQTPDLDLPPERRSVGYVPQHGALFPHLSVERNVAFSGADKNAVAQLLERMRIDTLAGELPATISGGERQRVALARALARRPRVLLLDEPLAALDAHTRRHVRGELAAELQALSIPTLLVTHDFADAAALASRIAVIADGEIRQTGTPEALAAEPADELVATLIGG